jgi:hypothetical protein
LTRTANQHPAEHCDAAPASARFAELDSIRVFNSNSPEVVQTEGILLSTFPPEGK